MVVAGQIDALRHDDDDDGVRAELVKRCPDEQSCSDGTIIVIIMNLWNCLFSVTKSRKFMLAWNPGVSRVEITQEVKRK